jgi:hypothetical protein
VITIVVSTRSDPWINESASGVVCGNSEKAHGRGPVDARASFRFDVEQRDCEKSSPLDVCAVRVLRDAIFLGIRFLFSRGDFVARLPREAPKERDEAPDSERDARENRSDARDLDKTAALHGRLADFERANQRALQRLLPLRRETVERELVVARVGRRDAHDCERIAMLRIDRFERIDIAVVIDVDAKRFGIVLGFRVAPAARRREDFGDSRLHVGLPNADRNLRRRCVREHGDAKDRRAVHGNRCGEIRTFEFDAGVGGRRGARDRRERQLSEHGRCVRGRRKKREKACRETREACGHGSQACVATLRARRAATASASTAIVVSVSGHARHASVTLCP